MNGDFRSDYFADQAVITVRTQTGANGLGEAVYESTARSITGLLVIRPKQVWRDLGLTTDVDAIFMTTDPCADLAAPATLTAGGRIFHDVTIAKRSDLWGDSVTRLLLHAEAR